MNTTTNSKPIIGRGYWLRFLAVLLTLVMVMGTIPASAAKKTSSVEVSTKASLVKAIKKDGKATITLKTDKAVSIKIPSTQGSTTKKLVIDAPNASINNKTQFDTSGKTPAVIIKAVKYYTESVSGNTITLSGDGARINVSEKKTLKSLTVNGDNADICVRKKGKIENLTFKKKGATARLEATNKSKVNVTLSKKTSLTVLGEKSADVNVKSSAKGSTVKASIPVDLTATKNTNFAMNQGAEGSTVDKSSSKVKVTITNKSKSEPVVTINGEAQATATPKPTATSKPTATATPTTTPTGSSAPVIEIYDGGSSGGYSGGGSSSGGGYSGGYTPAPTNEVTPGPIVPTPDPVTPTEEVTPTEGVTTIPTEEVTTPTENPVTPTDAVTASPAEEVTPTEQITDEEFDSTVKIGEITFPIQSAWTVYMSPTDQGNGVYLGAYMISDVQIYMYESVAIPEKDFQEAISSKANFEYIGQLFVDELAKQAGATDPKVEVFDEDGVAYGKTTGSGNVQGVNMPFAIYFKLQDNNFIVTMAMEMGTSISEKFDTIAFEACKLAKGSENTTTPTETVTPTGTVDEDGNIIVTENDGAIVYKYSPEGVLLSKTIIDNGNKYEYYYDNSGKLVSERHTNFDGTVWNYEYEYDEQGNKSKYTQVNSDGSRYEHIYDISGKEIEFVQKWPNDDGGYRVRFKKTYEFNENNQVVKAIETSYDGNTPEIYITEYEYNNSGSQIKKSVTTPDGYTAILEYVFDEKGRTLKYILTDSDGDVHEYPFAYDEEDKQVQYVRQPGSGRNSRGAFCFQVVVCEVGASGHTDTETSYIGGEFYWKEERKYDETGKMIWKRITESDGSVTEYVLNEEDVFVIDSGIDIEEVEINEETFPDAIFREFIKANYDKNGDGSLSKSEIEVITEISCTPSDYLDMADLGIRRDDFENDSQYEDAMHQAVREYWESGNGIKDLKGIEYFKNLRSLDCSWNQIERLVLNENTLLKSLNCRINKLKSIEFGENDALLYILCSENQIERLDLENLRNLQSLHCEYNSIIALDTEYNTELEYLDCDYNQITTLDITNNVLLQHLNCSHNQISNLDVKNNIAMTELSCDYNQIENIDISQNIELEYFSCCNNNIAELDVANNIALEVLYCSNLQIESLDLSNNADLEDLDCSYNALTELNVSNLLKLKELNCSYNPIALLDLSNNTELEYLRCYETQLTTLDLSNNPKLVNNYDDYYAGENVIIIK